MHKTLTLLAVAAAIIAPASASWASTPDRVRVQPAGHSWAMQPAGSSWAGVKVHSDGSSWA